MAFTVVDDLYSQAELDEMYPIKDAHNLADYDRQMKAVLAGDDDRLAMIVGPCSAYSPDAVYEYADRLTDLRDQVRDRLLIVMRVYLQKPRTTLGWQGIMTQPDPNKPHNLREGGRLAREMMHRVGQQLPMADEMLFTHNAHSGEKFDPLLTYVAVGARSSEDTEHRQMASGLESAVGIKNPTSGDIKKGVDGVQVASRGHHMHLGGKHVETTGNEYAHLILRGGSNGSNFGPQSIIAAHAELTDPKRGIPNPAIVVDASHDNSKVNGSGKDPRIQPLNVSMLLQGKESGHPAYDIVRGVSVESFLHEGSQPISDNMVPGLSITDPCLGWEETERMIRQTADRIDALLGRCQAA